MNTVLVVIIGGAMFLGGIIFIITMNIASNALAPPVIERLSRWWTNLLNVRASRSRKRLQRRIHSQEKLFADANALATGVSPFAQVALTSALYALGALLFLVSVMLYSLAWFVTVLFRSGNETRVGVGIMLLVSIVIAIGMAARVFQTIQRLNHTRGSYRKHLADNIVELQKSLNQMPVPTTGAIASPQPVNLQPQGNSVSVGSKSTGTQGHQQTP